MKKILNVLVAIASVVCFSSCSQTPQEMLVGTWKIDQIETDQEIPDDQKEFYDKMMEDLKNNSSFTFNADGTMLTKVEDQENKGEWKISEDGTTLTVKESGRETSSTIKELTSEKLTFTDEENGVKTSLTLVKQK